MSALAGGHVVYLAGPEVFLRNAIEIGEAKIDICAAHGFDAIFPLVSDDAGPPDPNDRARYIFEQCVEMMDRCTLAIANMTPFRGVSMDVGTAVEMGYMFAKGHPVFGYTNVVENYDARVPEDALKVERFNLADNLMCEGPVWQSGGAIIRTQGHPAQHFTDLRGFAACVKQAASVLGIG
jgi:nucleoside 2-deoxyribosyltransferase